MALYEYHCPANGRTVEVRHGMDDRVGTWGEVCDRTGVEPGDTPAGARVTRLMSAAAVAGAGPSMESPAGGCGSGCACVPG